MITLKESILSRSNHGAKGFEAQRRELIEDWLKEYNINNYTINDDFTIDVDEDVDIYAMNSKEFPEYIQFGIVKGDFGCIRNNLKSLKGAPREVEGNFFCFKNKLISLEGAPKKIGGDFYCDNNQLTTLRGCPRIVEGDFNCAYNELTSLEGAPEKVGDDFYCKANNLTSLEGAPREVGGDFDCSLNPTEFTRDDVKKVCHVRRRIIV